MALPLCREALLIDHWRSSFMSWVTSTRACYGRPRLSVEVVRYHRTFHWFQVEYWGGGGGGVAHSDTLSKLAINGRPTGSRATCLIPEWMLGQGSVQIPVWAFPTLNQRQELVIHVLSSLQYKPHKSATNRRWLKSVMRGGFDTSVFGSLYQGSFNI